MAHFSETQRPLIIQYFSIKDKGEIEKYVKGFTDACLLILPSIKSQKEYINPLKGVGAFVDHVVKEMGSTATIITIGEIIDLVKVQAELANGPLYQLWITIKRSSIISAGNKALPNHHFGALVHTKYSSSLRHTKTRIKYSYCPVCDKTTKDYGGKKHIYHEYGTSISDVWRDIECNLDGDLSPVINRFADLFGIDGYSNLRVLDCRQIPLSREAINDKPVFNTDVNILPNEIIDKIMPPGDCLERLKEIPDNSIDFVFADPPYNLKKNYSTYTDDLEIKEYFLWCDQWINELSRILKPGRTCAILNIPLWAIRHFLHLENNLQFQNWITWDALAFPVRMIMPAHYTILCFTKGPSRDLPGMQGKSGKTDVSTAPMSYKSLQPLGEGFCLRDSCVKKRIRTGINDRGLLTDLWWDIHRLKHNSRRVDHPCQLPPQLMYRLISIFTKVGEIVLDCFNGAGTTTLAAHQLNRKYVGIETSEKYCQMAEERHNEINNGVDPFRKEERILTAKNSPVKRMIKQKYEINKKTLQLEVKRIAQMLGHIPSREELQKNSKYDIKLYDEYFVSWGEVCAAARTTGMNENRGPLDSKYSKKHSQLSLGIDD